MTREMQDGINSDAAGMDHNIALVAYYIDSTHFTWTPAEIALFPHSVHVRIATKASTNDGNVLDVETGDATPAQAVQWARMRRASGYAYPTIYCSMSLQATVIAAFHAVGEPLPLWWIAHYDNLDVLPAGWIAKQYADPGPLDRSVVADVWPGVDGAVPEMELTDKVPVPNLDANGNYAGDGTPAPVSDLLRFSDASVRWLVEQWVPAVNTQLTAIQGALSAEESDLLAAIKAVGTVTATVDPTALATDLVTAGLPAALVAALLAVLNKAAA